MMILRNPETGEQVVTDSPDGYPGWTVVEDDVARPRGHSVREDGRWRIDRERTLPPTVDRLAEQVAELTARVKALEEQLNAQR